MTGRTTARLSLSERQAGRWSSTTRAPITDQACPRRRHEREPSPRRLPEMIPSLLAGRVLARGGTIRRASRGPDEESTPQWHRVATVPPGVASPPRVEADRRANHARRTTGSTNRPRSGRASALHSGIPRVKRPRPPRSGRAQPRRLHGPRPRRRLHSGRALADPPHGAGRRGEPRSARPP